VSAPTPDTAPIEDYIAELDAVLRGPIRAKARLVQEIHDGLTDAAAVHIGEGMSHPHAELEAVREFGGIAEVAPSCQQELTIAQARHTARAVALTVPFLLACWYVLSTAGPGPGWQLPRMAQLFAVQLAGVAAIAALLATATLAATGTLARRIPTPPRLPLAMAWTGTTAAITMALASLAFAIASLMATDWPFAAIAGALAATAHATVASSARLCRNCAARSA
jgi:hypothetical protein